MRKRSFAAAKMMQILPPADRTLLGEVAKQHGTSEPTIYNLLRHFGAMDTADVKILRELERENVQPQSLFVRPSLWMARCATMNLG